jgi:hypothetical protein
MLQERVSEDFVTNAIHGKDLASVTPRTRGDSMIDSMPEKTMFETFQPQPQQIEQLIEQAHNHPLGIQFLLEGDLCAVAILFGVHVFTVEAARKNLTA